MGKAELPLWMFFLNLENDLKLKVEFEGVKVEIHFKSSGRNLIGAGVHARAPHLLVAVHFMKVIVETAGTSRNRPSINLPAPLGRADFVSEVFFPVLKTFLKPTFRDKSLRRLHLEIAATVRRGRKTSNFGARKVGLQLIFRGHWKKMPT